MHVYITAWRVRHLRRMCIRREHSAALQLASDDAQRLRSELHDVRHASSLAAARFESERQRLIDEINALSKRAKDDADAAAYNWNESRRALDVRYVCVSVSSCARLRGVCICVCICVYLCVFVCICVYLCVFVCICVNVSMCFVCVSRVCASVLVCICVSSLCLFDFSDLRISRRACCYLHS